MKRLKVNLGDRSYPIFIAENALHKLGEMLRLFAAPTDLVVITDENVNRLYRNQLDAALESAQFHANWVVVSAGEASKSLDTFGNVVGQLLERRAARDWGVVAFGGGVVGDLAGFVAATYMRGLPFFQIPTSLLAQVDASIGGKVAINHPQAKNVIGAFYQPRLVFIDVSLLQSLPQSELVCGLAEIVKHGVIRDRDLFHYCETHLRRLMDADGEVLSNAIFRSCEIKAAIVAEDEREAGIRALLNFGHTVGHALESVTDYRRFRHGEAVFWGMLAEAWLSCQMGLLPQAEFERMQRFFHQIPLSAALDGIDMNDVLDLMAHDKKVMGGRLRFALPVTLGEARLFEEIPPEMIRQALSYIQSCPWKP